MFRTNCRDYNSKTLIELNAEITLSDVATSLTESRTVCASGDVCDTTNRKRSKLGIFLRRNYMGIIEKSSPTADTLGHTT